MNDFFDALIFQIFHRFVRCVSWFTEKSLATLWWDNINITCSHMSRHALIHICTGSFLRPLIYVYVAELVLRCAICLPKRLTSSKFAFLILTLDSIKSLLASIHDWLSIFPLVAVTTLVSSNRNLAQRRLYIRVATPCGHSTFEISRFLKSRVHLFDSCIESTGLLLI